MVGEGVLDGKLTISVGVEGSVSVVAGARIDVATVGTVADWVSCIVGLTGAHPAKARTRIKKRDNIDNGFIIETFPVVVHLSRD
ncbi:MAG: hypothetical protein RBS68_15295 [Anaerolineales bacterium]|jgi:hypothetical protein|nr:hypothetical protein [Anaerolineales bacterium]